MRPTLYLAGALLIAGLLPGCSTLTGGGGDGGASRLSVAPAEPSAEGTVTFGKGKNGNTSIDLSVRHLAQPGRLTPPENVYVVWTRRSGNAPPTNIGMLTVDKDLTGTLTTVTPLQSFELFITAEQAGTVDKPSGPPLLWTSH